MDKSVVNNGNIRVKGPTPTVTNTTAIALFGQGGNDTLQVVSAGGGLPQTTFFGGSGNDTMIGGTGVDIFFGGSGNDVIDGNQGNDIAFMGSGDDTFVWDPGDGSDVIEGEEGFDTMQFNGSGGNEIFELTANGNRLRFTRNLGNIVMDTNDLEQVNIEALGGTDTVILNDLSGTDVQQLNVDLEGFFNGNVGDGQVDQIVLNGTNVADFVEVLGQPGNISVIGLPTFVTIKQAEATDSLTINALGGDDQVSASSLPAGVIRYVVDGGAGDDTFFGSQGADVFLGGDGDDFIVGGRGDDLALMGSGDDIFVWNPGDGNDILEGQDGTDSMLFNGNNANENINMFANGGRFIFFRDVANVTMDTNDLERVTFNAFGGTDNIVIGDLSGTDVNDIRISLIGGSGQANDGVEDRIVINGTAGNDVIVASTVNKETTVSGLPATVRITGADTNLDRLDINGQAGNDVIDATNLQANLFKYTASGGLGNDIFLGSAGDDLFIGGDGDDVALMGAGNDTFVWNPGDDNDTLEGQAGIDTMLFNGANVAENIDISANGGRVLFFRDVANVLMDLNDVETINFNALGGADNIVIHDLSGTDMQNINLNLGNDAQMDTVTVNGTNGNDSIQVATVNGNTVVAGLTAQVNISGQTPGLDRLQINALAGDDVIDASAFGSNNMQLIVDAGAGDDVITGSSGNDVLIGNAGDDVILAGAGDDIALGGDGDDILLGEDGDDVLQGDAGNDVLIGGAGDDILLSGEVVID